MRFENKVVLITGNGSGLGRVASVMLAREGAAVVGCGRTEEAGRETVRLVEEVGGKALFVRADVSKSEDVRRLVQNAQETFGRIDILVNNASILFSTEDCAATFEPLTSLTDTAIDQLIDINLKGLIITLREVLPVMIAQGGGTVVNVGSNSGLLGYPLVHAYGAAKAGMAALTRHVAATFTAQGIRANSVAAGIFDSPMADSIKPFVAKAGPLFNPMSRLGTMEEIAHAVLFLASDESSFVQGTELVVDGGQAIAALPPIDLAALMTPESTSG